MKLIFVRHGQTELNINNDKQIKRMQGQTNSPLNDVGIKQAEEISNELVNKNIDVILVSPLDRAMQTAKIINKKLNKKLIIENRLIEISYGDLEGKEYKSEYWDFDYDYKSIGGENISDFKTRIFSLLEDLKAKYKNNTILLVAHGGVSRMIRCYFEGMPMNNNFATYGVGNCELMEYEI